MKPLRRRTLAFIELLLSDTLVSRMPIYPTQFNTLTSLPPGESLTLFSGTETPSAGLASIPFSRATGASVGPPEGMTFFCEGIPSGATLAYQVSNDPRVATNPTAAQWTTPPGATFVPDANGNAALTDIGYSTFYRILLSAYTSGAMPTVIVQR